MNLWNSLNRSSGRIFRSVVAAARADEAAAPLAIYFCAAAAGILADYYLRPGRLGWTAALAVFGFGWLGCFGFSFLFKRRDDSFELFQAAAVWTLVLCFFGLWHQFWRDRYPTDEIGLLIPASGSPATLELMVDSLPTLIRAEPASDRLIAPQDRTMLRVHAVRIKNHGRWQTVSGHLAAALSGDWRRLRIGDHFLASGILYHPSGPKNPDDYDTAFQLRAERTLLHLNVSYSESVQILATKTHRPIRRFFETLRRRTQATFERNLSDRSAALASAMILGIRSELDDDAKGLFRETGTAHLLAISGAHIALVTGFFFLIFRLLGFSGRTTAAGLAFCALFYLMMTDLRPSAIRAVSLVLVLCGGMFLRRRAVNLNSLCAAAIFLLLLNPMNLFQPGALLSFLATGVFLWLPARSDTQRTSEQSPLLRRFAAIRLRRPGWARLLMVSVRAAGRFKTLAIVSLAIWIVVLPLVLRLSNVMAPVAIVINPLTWFPMACSLISGIFLALSAAILPPLEPLFGHLCDFCFTCFEYLLILARSAPYGHFQIGGPAAWWCAIFYGALIFWTLFPSLRPRKRFLLTAALVWTAVGIGVSVFEHRSDLRHERLRVDILSVGHGGAILIHFPDRRTVLYDCGSFSGGESVARRTGRVLFARGKTRIDLMIFSHADADHFNGFFELAETFPIGAVAISPTMFDKSGRLVESLRRELDERNIPIHRVSAGESLAPLGFSELSVLHPNRSNHSGDSNASSLVISLEHLGRRILLSGDLDSKQADFLQTPARHYDLILAPHHGGKSDNYRDLLHWATPRAVVISGGKFLRSEESEKSLRREGFIVWNTFEHGAAKIEIDRAPKPNGSLGRLRLLP